MSEGLAHFSAYASIASLFVALLAPAWSWARHHKATRRVTSPERDSLDELKDRLGAVRSARKDFQTRSEYQTHLIHASVGMILPVVTFSFALLFIAITGFFVAGAGRSMFAIVVLAIATLWAWFGYQLAKIYDNKRLIVSDFDRQDDLQLRIDAMEVAPLK